jgi:hypothetical protein
MTAKLVQSLIRVSSGRKMGPLFADGDLRFRTIR